MTGIKLSREMSNADEKPPNHDEKRRGFGKNRPFGAAAETFFRLFLKMRLTYRTWMCYGILN